MKSRLLPALPLAATLAFPVLAQAHPGHDGDHDFVWEFGHLVGHPFATVSGLVLLAATAWGVWKLVQGRPAAKTERIKRD